MKRTIVILIVFFICTSTLMAKTPRDLPPSGVYRIFGAKTADTDYNFIINNDFRSGIAADEKLYITTYDNENDIYYPVMRIDVLK